MLLFVKSIDRKEREAIGVQLEDDDDVNGLIEDWAKPDSSRIGLKSPMWGEQESHRK